MSAWKKEALKRLPELRAIIDVQSDKDPTNLYAMLELEFQKLCKQKSPPLELLGRIWEFARWSMARRGAAGPAATLEFCEHLLDTKASGAMLPKIMSRQEFEQLKGVLMFHNTEQDFLKALALFK